MGPRSDERGKPKGVTHLTPEVMLQWGRVRMNAERRRRVLAVEKIEVLQWGRVRMNAESAGIASDGCQVG